MIITFRVQFSLILTSECILFIAFLHAIKEPRSHLARARKTMVFGRRKLIGPEHEINQKGGNRLEKWGPGEC